MFYNGVSSVTPHLFYLLLDIVSLMVVGVKDFKAYTTYILNMQVNTYQHSYQHVYKLLITCG